MANFVQSMHPCSPEGQLIDIGSKSGAFNWNARKILMSSRCPDTRIDSCLSQRLLLTVTRIKRKRRGSVCKAWTSYEQQERLKSNSVNGNDTCQFNFSDCVCGSKSEIRRKTGRTNVKSVSSTDENSDFLERKECTKEQYSRHKLSGGTFRLRDLSSHLSGLVEEKDNLLFKELRKRTKDSPATYSFQVQKPENSSCWLTRDWKFMSAAAAAGLSLSLCSSAIAEPVGQGLVDTGTSAAASGTLLRHELQGETRTPKVRLEDVEFLVRQNVSRPKICATTLSDPIKQDNWMAPSPIVPHPSAHRSVEAFAPKETILLDRSPLQKKPTFLIQSLSTEKPPTDLVAVSSLGSVITATSRTTGAALATSLVNVQAGTSVAASSLLSRILLHFAGGGIAGAMGATVVYPLDTIKTRLQAQSSKDGEEPLYKGELDCLQQLVANEGLGSLYSGLLPQLIGIAPEKAIKLTVNEILMSILESKMPGVRMWALEAIAGGGGGFSQVIFTNPMEIVKVQLQTQSKDSKQKSTWDVVKTLGVQGLYNGSCVTMARDIPSSAIFFAVYSLIRQLYPDQSFAAGCIAAIPATFLVTPIDVIKTRIQMEIAVGEMPYENAWHCFVCLWDKEGPRGLFKGSLARVLKTSPQFGITFMLYNIICKLS